MNIDLFGEPIAAGSMYSAPGCSPVGSVVTDLPAKHYRTIAIDPPWPGPGEHRSIKGGGVTIIPYSTMTGIQLAAMRIMDIATDQDGLRQEWAPRRCWMNPPYGRVIGDWMRKAYEESKRGATVACLVPARTDTRWWHDYAMKGQIRFIRGRLKFGAGKANAPFPSALIVFTENATGQPPPRLGGGSVAPGCWNS